MKGTTERIKRVQDTLNDAGAELEVCWKSANGVEDRIVWRNGSPIVLNRDLPTRRLSSAIYRSDFTASNS